MYLEEEYHTFNQFEAYRKVILRKTGKNIRKWIFGLLIGLILVLLLPWTQNIRTKGTVSALNPAQRPQTVNSILPGQIAKWYVKEGDIVNKGDTLLQITEVKDDYLDPQLIERTDQQLKAKSATIDFYKSKAGTMDIQLEALKKAQKLKLDQLRNKYKQYTLQVKTDSMAFLAAQSQLKIAIEQFSRQEKLYKDGLKSLTELEQRRQALQDAQAKNTATANKFYNSKNELLIIQLELAGTEQEYLEKISKTEGERFTTLSQAATGESEVAKLQNQLSNYKLRRGFYYITAPQSGQILQTIKAGIGETVKDGEQLLQIVPQDYDSAVEILVAPVDMPLIRKGQKIRLQFDGYPAIVFSGWPQASYGTFSGEIVAIDNSTNNSGKFKIWAKQDPKEKKWPPTLKLGAGVEAILLLNDVPIWYEIWRKINAFPPDFYQEKSVEPKKGKK